MNLLRWPPGSRRASLGACARFTRVTHPLGTPRGLPANAGILASAGWLVARGLYIQPDKPRRVDIVPPLKELGVLLRYLEQRFAIHLQRGSAAVETTIAGAVPVIRAWVASL